MSSEFKVEVIKVGTITKHPNADSLSMTTVNGQNCIIKTGDLLEGDVAVYVPEDAVVPLNNPAFTFLRRHDEDTVARIKAIRLRKIYSEGILVPIKKLSLKTAKIGADVAADLGVVKYEQPINTNSNISMKAERQAKDPGCAPRYDMEPFLKNADFTFFEGEEVVCTEKIHGCNFRAVYTGGKLHVGSHNTFRSSPFKPSKFLGFLNAIKSAFFTGSKNLTFRERWGRGYAAKTNARKVDPWWKIAKDTNLAEKLRTKPKLVLYGEIYGHVQDLKYSVPEAEIIRFVAFDMYDSKARRWLNYDEAKTICSEIGISWAPELYRGGYHKDKIIPLRSGKSAIDGVTIREGLVIRRANDTVHGRATLKLVSEEYKLRNEGTEFQ